MSVETFNHRITVAASTVATTDVLVLVRPEAVRLGTAGSDRLSGVVEEIEYRGDRIEYRVRVGTALIVAIELALRTSVRIAEGDRVGLQFMEEGLHLLPAVGHGGPRQ